VITQYIMMLAYAIGEVWFFGLGGLRHGECGAQTYNGGLGAVPPAGSRGRAPGEGSGGRSPLKLKTFRVLEFERSYILTTNLLYLPLVTCKTGLNLKSCV